MEADKGVFKKLSITARPFFVDLGLLIILCWLVCPSTACQRGFYRHSLDAKHCLKCPPNSLSNESGATSCSCNAGFYRAPSEGQNIACTRELHTERENNNPHRLGDEFIESSTGEELEGTGGWRIGHELAVWTCSPESQVYPGLYQKHVASLGEGKDSLLPLCSLETSCGGLHPGLGPPVQERHGPIGSGLEEGPKNDCRDVTPLLWRRVELGLFSLRRESFGKIILWPFNT